MCGVRHSMASILAMVAAACGESWWLRSRSGARLAEGDKGPLAAPGAPPPPGDRPVLHPTRRDLRRAFAAVDAQSLDDVPSAWMLEQLTARPGTALLRIPPCSGPVPGPPLRPGFAADGKAGKMDHLLPAFAHQAGVTLAQRQDDPKGNEITGFASLIRDLDLRGWAMTMNTLHTQRGHARFLHCRGIDFIMIAKDNQPACSMLPTRSPGKTYPSRSAPEEHGHGRHEIRTIQPAAAPPSLSSPTSARYS